jgi:hypothetical protein
MTLSVTGHSTLQCSDYAEFRYAECRVLFTAMLSVNETAYF